MSWSQIYPIIVVTNLALSGYLIWQWRRTCNSDMATSRSKMMYAAAAIMLTTVCAVQLGSLVKQRSAATAHAVKMAEIAAIRTEVESIGKDVQNASPSTLQNWQRQKDRLAELRARLTELGQQ
jgi:heme A synthase